MTIPLAIPLAEDLLLGISWAVVDDGAGDVEALDAREETSGGVLVEITGRVPAHGLTVAHLESAPSSEIRGGPRVGILGRVARGIAAGGGFVGSRVEGGAGERGGERARGSRNANAGGVFAEARRFQAGGGRRDGALGGGPGFARMGRGTNGTG